MLYDNERAILTYQVRALKDGSYLPEEDVANLLRSTYLLLNSNQDGDYNLCLSAICHVSEIENKSPRIRDLLNECIIKSRVFLYQDMLSKHDGQEQPELDIFSGFAKVFYTSEYSQTTFTKDQRTILETYRKHPRVVVSAPTSFGKTKIIEEILLEYRYNNIVLIFPTIALLSEQYNRIKKSPLGKEYTVSKSSRTNPAKGKNILILTPERLISFLDEYPDFKPDFFAMDEIYKSDAASEDERFRVFTYCLYRLSQVCKNFYLIGPFFTDFSKGFCERFDAKFMRFQSEIVQKDFYTKGDLLSGRFSGSPVKVVLNNNVTLSRSIVNLADKRSLIYRYRKSAAETTALHLAGTKEETDNYNPELVKYIADTVSPKWGMIDCLKKGVAFHHGGVPRHIQEAIIEAFEKGEIEQIVCTTSLTEGVNTSAKSVFLLDSTLGQASRHLKPFERKNIEGRSGRFKTHFTGNVIYLDEFKDDNEDDYKIELEYWEGDKITLESLIQVDNGDLREGDKEKKQTLFERLEELNIPATLIRSNRYISVEGQISLINYLRTNITDNSCSFEGYVPNGNTLDAILSLTYQHLFSETDKRSKTWTERKVIGTTKYWISQKPNIPLLIGNDIIATNSKNIDTRIRNVFAFTSHFFEFAWPKYIKAFSNIYNHVANEMSEPEINLEFLLMKLEYGADEIYEVALKDAGVPNDIIKKIGHLFEGCETFDKLHSRYDYILPELKALLTNFELHLLEEHL